MQLCFLVVILYLGQAALYGVVDGLVWHVEDKPHVQLGHLRFYRMRFMDRKVIPEEGNRLEPIRLPQLHQVVNELGDVDRLLEDLGVLEPFLLADGQYQGVTWLVRFMLWYSMG